MGKGYLVGTEERKLPLPHLLLLLHFLPSTNYLNYLSEMRRLPVPRLKQVLMVLRRKARLALRCFHNGKGKCM